MLKTSQRLGSSFTRHHNKTGTNGPFKFQDKHKEDVTSKMYWIKNFDYVGTFLFAGGFIVFLLGKANVSLTTTQLTIL
jgi:hypothetical protein